MTRRVSRCAPLIVAGAIASLVACGPGGGDDGPLEVDCVADLLPGDLVITEIMGNPDGGDDGNEWFEVYNTTGGTIDLSGVQLVYNGTPGDLESARVHIISDANPADDITIDSGQYFVFGGILKEFAPAYVDYGYADGLGGLGNSESRELALRCDNAVVDSVVYSSMADGASMSLSALIFPDAMENDDWENSWCESMTVFAEPNQGTPGEPNDCVIQIDGMCLDNGVLRPVVTPVFGDLVITEVMPNPSAVGDTDGEWFEVKVVNDFDLNGVTLGRDPLADPDDLIASDDGSCLPASAGSYLIFARNADTATNGNLPPVDVEYGFSLINSDGRLYLGDGIQVLDEITWAGSPNGASLTLNPNLCDTRANDEPESWCISDTTAYGDGDLGTPGAGNQECPPPPPGPGECFDVGTGMVREIVAPGVGDLVITEFMANPDIIGDPDGEWIEVRVDASVDLNELEVRKLTNTGTADSTIIDAAECLSVAAGEYAVFTRDGDPMVNGCIDSELPIFDISLNNSNNTIFLTRDMVDIDSVMYGSTAAGSSSSLDEMSGTWCSNAVDVYDTCLASANTGTPGAANPSCPP